MVRQGTNADRRQRGRRTRSDFINESKAAFMKRYPTWVGEHGPSELDNVLDHLLAEGELTVSSSPRTAVNKLYWFMEPPQ